MDMTVADQLLIDALDTPTRVAVERYAHSKRVESLDDLEASIANELASSLTGTIRRALARAHVGA